MTVRQRYPTLRGERMMAEVEEEAIVLGKRGNLEMFLRNSSSSRQKG